MTFLLLKHLKLLLKHAGREIGANTRRLSIEKDLQTADLFKIKIFKHVTNHSYSFIVWTIDLIDYNNFVFQKRKVLKSSKISKIIVEELGNTNISNKS